MPVTKQQQQKARKDLKSETKKLVEDMKLYSDLVSYCEQLGIPQHANMERIRLILAEQYNKILIASEPFLATLEDERL